MTVNLINANLTLILATVDALACLEPQPLVYIDTVSGGWYFVLLGYPTYNPRTYGRRTAGRTLALIHICTAVRPPDTHWI